MKFFTFILISFCLVLFSCSGNSQKDAPSNDKVKSTKTTKSSKKNTKKKNNVIKDAKPIPPKQLEAAKAIIKRADEEELAALDGLKLFKTHCALCHGFKGDMKINGAKDLTKSEISLNEAVAQVYFGRGLMQPYKGLLSDTEIIAVSKYSETLRKK